MKFIGTCPPIGAYAKHPLPVLNTTILDSGPPGQWFDLPSIAPTYVPSYTSQPSPSILAQIQCLPQLTDFVPWINVINGWEDVMYLVVTCQSGPILIYSLDRTEVSPRKVGKHKQDEFVIQSGIEC